MWILKKLSDGSTKYLISEGKSYTVGRKNCDIVLQEDGSISRKHCTVHIAKQNECPFAINTPTGVWVVDEQSKYGTYLKNNNDWIKLSPNQNKKLSNGSVIKFGLIDNIWSLEFKPVVACTSGVPPEQKKKMEATLQLVDGFLRNAWCKECSLVIVNEITLTIKVVLALINGIPIVTPDYVDKLVDSIKNQTAPPLYEDYRPTIKESILDISLVSLDIKKTRKELFKGKKFVIPTKKQLETLKDVILSAGGTVELLSSAGNWERFAEENTVLIQLPLSSTKIPEEACKLFKQITAFLKNKYGRRVIPESEIAQAVAYSSIEKFCNPTSSCFNLLTQEKQVDPGVLLIQETPDIIRANIPETCVVPASEPISATFSCPSSSSNEKDQFQKTVEDRKRTHSPDKFHEELRSKKARGCSTKNKDSEEFQDALENETLRKKSKTSETPPNKAVKTANTATKTTSITNFFPKQLKSISKNTDKLPKKNSFWTLDPSSSETTKRKHSMDSDNFGENSEPKRAKITQNLIPQEINRKQTSPEPAIETPREVVAVVEQVNNNKNSFSSTSFRKAVDVEADSDFSDYIERERTSILDGHVDELSTTIFSLTIISSAYLKPDGSLIDPPTTPVNVKKFKKQKILSVNFTSGQNEDELSDGEWIEPHSERVYTSIHGDEEW